MKVGDTKTVWFVLDLSGEPGREKCWVFDRKQQADGQARSMRRAQVTKAIAVASTFGGSLMHWDVKRPKRQTDAFSLLPSPSTPTPTPTRGGSPLTG